MKTINNNLEKYKLFASRYTYNPEVGKLTNIRTGYSEHKPTNWGYIQLTTKLNGKMVAMKAHRLAWFIYYGEMPPTVVDHINEDKTDNRISNLQLLSSRANKVKSIKAKGGTSSQYTGVVWRKDRSKWQAAIKPPNGKRKYLGLFDNEFVAANAYANALNSLSKAG